jgi:hypothetical protein
MKNIENANLEQLIKGYILNEEDYICLYCGQTFVVGEMFNFNNHFYEASKAIKIHLTEDHPNRLAELLNLDSRYLSLTANQKELFSLFHSGMSDNEIANKLGVAASTVRHQKFVFRERAKAAKLYLAAWSIVEENKNKQSELMPIHEGATMVDERYVVTEEENRKILQNVFISLDPLKLKVLSPKEKKKIVILRKIAEKFDEQKNYTEKEVNAILKPIYEDYASLRRYLIEYGYMGRTTDCTSYWKK